jgi:hypothetical protein
MINWSGQQHQQIRYGEYYMSDDTQTTIDNNLPEPTKATITILRYSVDSFHDTTDGQYIEMHEGAEIIHVYGEQLWARVDTSKPIVKRHIVSCRTGGPAVERSIGNYIGTVTHHTSVRHLFDCG